jgi:hypothetical protein
MILIDYFLYKIYALFYKDPMRGGLAGILSFGTLLFFNIITIWDVCFGYETRTEKLRYPSLFSMVCVWGVLYYIYIKKKRFQKIYDKYKNESKTWRIIGWILIALYITATWIFMSYTHRG